MSTSSITLKDVAVGIGAFIAVGGAITSIALGTLRLTEFSPQNPGDLDWLSSLTDDHAIGMIIGGGLAIPISIIGAHKLRLGLKRKSDTDKKVDRGVLDSSLPVDKADGGKNDGVGAAAARADDGEVAKPDEKTIRDNGRMKDAILTWDGQEKPQEETNDIIVVDRQKPAHAHAEVPANHTRVDISFGPHNARRNLIVHFIPGTSLEKIKAAITNYLPEAGNYVLLLQAGKQENHFLSEEYFGHMLQEGRHMSIEIQKVENMPISLEEQCGQNILMRCYNFKAERNANDPEKESYSLCPRKDVVKNLQQFVTKRKSPNLFAWKEGIGGAAKEIKLADISDCSASMITLTIEATERTGLMAESVIEYAEFEQNDHLVEVSALDYLRYAGQSDEYYYISVKAEWPDNEPEHYYRFRRDLRMDEIKEGLKFHMIRKLGNTSGNYVITMDELFCDEHSLFTKLAANPNIAPKLSIYRVTQSQQYPPDPDASNNILIHWYAISGNTRGAMLCPKAKIADCKAELSSNNENDTIYFS